MTKNTTATFTPDRLRAHARELAAAFHVRLIEHVQIGPDEAMAVPGVRVVAAAPITDETTYAAVLHELGHLIAPSGVVRSNATRDNVNLMLVEEEAAWEWAMHYALIWTPVMDRVRAMCFATYQRTQREQNEAEKRAADIAAAQHIDWNRWR